MDATVEPWHDGVMVERSAHLKPCTRIPASIGQSPRRASSSPLCLPARHALSTFVMPRPDRGIHSLNSPHGDGRGWEPASCAVSRGNGMDATVEPWHDGVMVERSAHLKPCTLHLAPGSPPPSDNPPPRCLPARHALSTSVMPRLDRGIHSLNSPHGDRRGWEHAYSAVSRGNGMDATVEPWHDGVWGEHPVHIPPIQIRPPVSRRPEKVLRCSPDQAVKGRVPEASLISVGRPMRLRMARKGLGSSSSTFFIVPTSQVPSAISMAAATGGTPAV